MITLKKLNGNEFALNCDLIETIQECPDTTIRMTNGSLYLVENRMDDVIAKIVEYRRKVFSSIVSQGFNKN